MTVHAALYTPLYHSTTGGARSAAAQPGADACRVKAVQWVAREFNHSITYPQRVLTHDAFVLSLGSCFGICVPRRVRRVHRDVLDRREHVQLPHEPVKKLCFHLNLSHRHSVAQHCLDTSNHSDAQSSFIYLRLNVCTPIWLEARRVKSPRRLLFGRRCTHRQSYPPHS